MKKLNRRDAMVHLGLGTAGLVFTPRGSHATPTVKTDGLEELAERLRRVSHDEVFGVGAEALRRGAGYETLLGAAFIAGIHDIRPRSVGGKLHAVMMVESAFKLSAVSGEEEARLAALWTLSDFKRSQERDRGEGDWVLPKRPDVRFASGAAARREFVAAMDAWDSERADRAIVGLLPFHGRETLFEILWPYAARSYNDIGHKIIYCGQVERVLRRLGWRYAEPALRSVIHALLYQGDSISGAELGAFERSRELLPSFPKAWLTGRDDPKESEGLLKRLRGADASQAQDLVLAAFRDGLGPATVWDGLRLYASDIFHRRPGSAARRHGPVHPVTEVHAFAHVFRTTDSETTKKLMILQAAAWLPLLERDLVRFFGSHERAGVDALSTASATARDFGDVFAEPSPSEALALMGSAASRKDYLSHLRHHLFRKGFQSHQWKYAASIHEESELIHPRWASRILAPAVTYVPTAVDPDTEDLERTLRALRG